MNFSPIKPLRLYQHVIQQVRQMIYAGRLKKGDKLPSEREFAALLGISRTSIREAMSALEILGIVESRHGEGTFIAEDPLNQRMVEPLSLLFMLEDNAEVQLIDVRKMLEEECAYLAAANATPEDIAALTQCICDFEHSADDRLSNIRIDQIFHFSIVKASENTLLYYLYTAIADVLEQHISKMRLGIVKKTENIGRLLDQHKRVYCAICEHNPEEARAAMADHMDFIKAHLIKMG